MLNLEKLLEHGICRSEVPGACEKCDFDFDYEGQYVDDHPYLACEVIASIIATAKQRKEAINV